MPAGIVAGLLVLFAGSLFNVLPEVRASPGQHIYVVGIKAEAEAKDPD
ncbi:hypothetical protein [Nitrososphaera viennensis]|uniref:Uncharacterized protein n=2 Tax=Nitrososphaera viennensis TaxID=1034015 RepID=A0A060HV38_9ARCH|nr:hypothetical protein [Nitrososphaera viennensis]AIC16897.1 exported protein of unknown function [Nitrososphaera viennensis EN76]UVS68802.1 hypothetical protein NWT39_12955 [Nitrososphaera viennensis]